MTFEPRDVHSLLSEPARLDAFRALISPDRLSDRDRNRHEFARSNDGRKRRNDRRAVRYAKQSFILNS